MLRLCVILGSRFMIMNLVVLILNVVMVRVKRGRGIVVGLGKDVV